MKPPDIPWQPFCESMREPVTPSVPCLWWVPIRDTIEVFVGRVVYWPAADCAMVARKSGSMVRVSAGAFFAVITKPAQLRAIDDAIDVADCGHAGFASIYPRKDGGSQCTICANAMRRADGTMVELDLAETVTGAWVKLAEQVSGSTASAALVPRLAALSPPLAAAPSGAPSPYPPGLD